MAKKTKPDFDQTPAVKKFKNEASAELGLNRTRDVVTPEKEETLPLEVDAITKMDQGLQIPKF